MTDMAEDTDAELDAVTSQKGKAAPLKRTKKQQLAAEKAALGAQLEAEKQDRMTRAQESATRLAQIVNLHIAGHSLAAIGAATGHTEQEIDRMLQNDMQRYVRTQPALRVYVRNFVSERYMALLDAIWDDATVAPPVGSVSALGFDKRLASQDRAIKILDRMAKLHGAEAPVQSEVKIDAAPEAVEALVGAIAKAQGLGYDVDIFDTVPGEVVHTGRTQAVQALEVSRNHVGDPSEDEADDAL